MKKIIMMMLAVLAINILVAQESRIEIKKDKNGNISEFIFNNSNSIKRKKHQAFFVSPQQKYCWIKSNLEPNPHSMYYVDYKKTKIQIYNSEGKEIKTFEIPYAKFVRNIVKVKDNGIIFFNKPIRDKYDDSGRIYLKELIIYLDNGRKEIKTGISNSHFSSYQNPKNNDIVVACFYHDGSIVGKFIGTTSVYVFSTDGELLGSHSIDRKYAVRIIDAKFISDDIIRFFGRKRYLIEHANGRVSPNYSKIPSASVEEVVALQRGDTSHYRKIFNLSFQLNLKNMTLKIEERADD